MNKTRKLAIRLQQLDENLILDNNKVFYLLDTPYALDYICVLEFVEGGYKFYNHQVLEDTKLIDKKDDIITLLDEYISWHQTLTKVK